MVLELTTEVHISQLAEELRSWYSKGYYLAEAPHSGSKQDMYLLHFKLMALHIQNPNIGDVKSGILRFHGLELNLDRFLLTREGVNIHLTPREFRIFAILASNIGKALTAMAILSVVDPTTSYSKEEAQNIIKVNIRRIRRKLELSDEDGEPSILVTVTGFGYMIVEEILPASH